MNSSYRSVLDIQDYFDRKRNSAGVVKDDQPAGNISGFEYQLVILFPEDIDFFLSLTHDESAGKMDERDLQTQSVYRKHMDDILR